LLEKYFSASVLKTCALTIALSMLVITSKITKPNIIVKK
jgi:hypothetical protein